MPSPAAFVLCRSVVRSGYWAALLIGAAAWSPAARAVEHGEVCRYCRAAAALAAAEEPAPQPRQYAPDRQADVTHIKLDVTPDFQRRSVAGTATIHFTPIAKPLETLRLDGVNLRVTAVDSSHPVRDWSAGRDAVTIVFDPPLEPGQPAHVAIQYSAEPVEGLYFRTPATGVDAGDAHCWTQGEPHEARHWFPCFDAPNERATSELVCRVPAEMTVVSNGRLVDDSTSDDGATRTFHWRQDKPHVSYLICFVAGLFEKIEGRQGDVPLAFYAQPSKAAHAASAFRHTAEALEFFESATGVPYPWDKYDQAVIADFLWGGMENTTITTLTQRTLYENEGDHVRAGRSRSLNAHELAHQWFGNYVTCKDWSHLWLNEGFATYYALLYDAVCDGPDALAYGLYLDARDEIFLPENVADRRPIVYRQYRTPSEQFDFRNYPKASWVIHMLRSRVGDELYQQAIHSYLQRHALGEVETDNLRKVFEELSGQTLDRFFDQWLYHGGHPQLTVKYDWLPNERLAHISIEQTQPTDDRTLLFEFPAVVRLVVDGEVVERRIDVTERRHDLYVRLPAEPQVMRFDPHYTLLAQVTFDKSDALLEADLARDDDVMGRVLACEALGKRRTGAAVAALQKAIENDPFYGVRQVAARALREIGTDDAVAALAAALDRQSDQRVRYTIVDELGRAYHANATARLREVAADVDELPVVAAAAIVGLGRTDAASAAAAIRAALASQSFNNERAVAAFLAIRELNDPRLGPALMQTIAQREAEFDARDLGEAFTTLAAISPRGRRQAAALQFLAGYLAHPRETLRLGAATALGQLRDSRARPLLEPLTAPGQSGRLAAAAKGALAALERQAELAPSEVGQLRRELRELRQSQAELQRKLDDLSARDEAEEPAAAGDAS